MKLGVWASVGVLRSRCKENERKTDPSHKPFRTPPGFCAQRTSRKQGLGRILSVLGWVSAFWWHHFSHCEEGVSPRSFTLVLSVCAEVDEQVIDREEAKH